MQNNRLFMIVSGAIGACVLLAALFAITVLGVAFDPAASAWVMLAAAFVGAAHIYCFYDIFISGRASMLLLPYKLVLVTITYIFTIVQILLVGIYLRFSVLSYLQSHAGRGASRFLEKLPVDTGSAGSSLMRMTDTGRIDVSGAFLILVLLTCVLFVALYAVVVYVSGVVSRQKNEDEARQSIERDLASRLIETLRAYRQFAARHNQLNFAAANRPADALDLKARSIRGLGDFRHADLEHRIMITCGELLDLFDKNRTEPVDQPCADDIGSKFNAILSDFSLLDRAMIK